MRTIKILRGVIIALSVAALVFLFVSASFSPPLPRTAQGVLFEELLPPHVLFAANFNPTDEAERLRFNVLWDAVLQDKAPAILPFLAQSFVSENKQLFAPSGVMNIVGANPRIMFVLTKNKKKNRTPAFYFLSEASNEVEARALLTRLRDTDNSYKTKIENKKAFVISHSGRKTLYIGLAKDIVFITDTAEENLQNFLRRFERTTRSFASSALFRNITRGFTPPLSGYVFISSEFSGEKEFGFLKATAVSFHAAENGVAFETLSLGDRTKTKSSASAGAVLQPYDAYLYKKLPASRAAVFVEAHHLGALLDIQFTLLQNMLGFSRQKITEGFKNFTGLDLFTDLLPHLNKGFAMVMQDAGSIIPGISVYIDAQNAYQQAQQIIKKIDEAVPVWISLGNIALQANKEQPPLEHVKFEEGNLRGGSINFYFDRVKFGEGEEISLFKFFKEPLSIAYGLTSDSILFISTLSNFKTAFAAPQTIESSPLFADLSNLGMPFGSISLISGQFIWTFAQHILDSARSAKNFSEQNETFYEILKKHLSPIEGILQVSRGDSRNIHGNGLLKIAHGSTSSP